MSTSTAKQIRSSRTLTLDDLTKSTVRRAYVPAPLDGFIHYIDVPSGLFLDVLEPGISVYEQLKASSNILVAAVVNPDGTPFFTNASVGMLSREMVLAIFRSLLRGDDREGEVEVDIDEVESESAGEGKDEEKQTESIATGTPGNE